MPKKKLYNGKGGIIYSTDSNFRAGEKINEEATLPPQEQVLKIRLDTKQRGGKMVTLVLGFLGKESDIEQLGRQLKSCCGTGGSVKDKEILIQGDNREKVLQWLIKMDYKKTKKL